MRRERASESCDRSLAARGRKQAVRRHATPGRLLDERVRGDQEEERMQRQGGDGGDVWVGRPWRAAPRPATRYIISTGYSRKAEIHSAPPFWSVHERSASMRRGLPVTCRPPGHVDVDLPFAHPSHAISSHRTSCIVAMGCHSRSAWRSCLRQLDESFE